MPQEREANHSQMSLQTRILRKDLRKFGRGKGLMAHLKRSNGVILFLQSVGNAARQRMRGSSVMSRPLMNSFYFLQIGCEQYRLCVKCKVHYDPQTMLSECAPIFNNGTTEINADKCPKIEIVQEDEKPKGK